MSKYNEFLEIIYDLILQYPYPGIHRSEKYSLIEWLKKEIKLRGIIEND